jgi:hypothetical protein
MKSLRVKPNFIKIIKIKYPYLNKKQVTYIRPEHRFGVENRINYWGFWGKDFFDPNKKKQNNLWR